jgi:two-component system phosphate regulon sensor histidine kinase PhoR
MKKNIYALMNSLPEPIISHIKHLERMRQDFVANVSHELRTPLTVIHGYLETLIEQNHEDTKPWKNIFIQMQSQTLRMEHLVEDLLLLSRLENEDEEAQPNSRITIDPLLKLIVREARELSNEANHHIELKTDSSLLLLGNEEELRSVFSNIIFNAVKYTPSEGHIWINWFCENQQAHFQVKDTGIGIAEKHIPRLTERFYRVDRGRSRDKGGTGLGLAITKHVLIRHQAKLEINSKIGVGSIFECIFPIKRTVIKSSGAKNE